MDNKEDILDALDEFNRKKGTTPEKMPLVLEQYLKRIATTGETLFPWNKLKPLFTHKLDLVMKEFYEQVPTDHFLTCSNVENVKFEEMRLRLLEAVNSFTGAPFTIQRLCELVTNPKQHYRRTDKFLRGIEKNVMVVTTVDPFGNKELGDQRVLVNGLDANGFNGAEIITATPEKPKGVYQPPPPPTNSPAPLGWATIDPSANGAGDVDSTSGWTGDKPNASHCGDIGPHYDPPAQDIVSHAGEAESRVTETASANVAFNSSNTETLDTHPASTSSEMLEQVQQAGPESLQHSSNNLGHSTLPELPSAELPSAEVPPADVPSAASEQDQSVDSTSTEQPAAFQNTESLTADSTENERQQSLELEASTCTPSGDDDTVRAGTEQSTCETSVPSLGVSSPTRESDSPSAQEDVVDHSTDNSAVSGDIKANVVDTVDGCDNSEAIGTTHLECNETVQDHAELEHRQQVSSDVTMATSESKSSDSILEDIDKEDDRDGTTAIAVPESSNTSRAADTTGGSVEQCPVSEETTDSRDNPMEFSNVPLESHEEHSLSDNQQADTSEAVDSNAQQSALPIHSQAATFTTEEHVSSGHVSPTEHEPMDTE